MHKKGTHGMNAARQGGTIRQLTGVELEAVSGGEILVSPGQLGIALTDNTLIVVTGLEKVATVTQVMGAGFTAFGIGYAIGSVLVENTDIAHTLGGWFYNMFNC